MVNTTEGIRDHFEECFRHFNEWFNSKISRGHRGRTEAMMPLADFCGVGRQTVARYLDAAQDSSLPNGEILIKLICYLDLHGYKVIEFERMATTKILRNFAELIGYSILTAEQASNLGGFKHVQYLYKVLWEKDVGLSRDRETKMWEIWKERRDELEQKKRQAFETSRLEILFKSTSQEKTPRQQVLALPEHAKSFSSRSSAMLLIMEGLLMSFEEGLFDNLSVDDLANLDMRSRSSILRLSVHLSTLSSKLMTTERKTDGQQKL